MKILAVRPNSMPDERTVSNFTWITPKERNRMSVTTMMDSVLVRQYYLRQNPEEVRVFIHTICDPKLIIFTGTQTRRAEFSSPLWWLEESSFPKPILCYQKHARGGRRRRPRA